jgi:hypothetical protein
MVGEKVPGASGPPGIMNHEGAEGAQRKDATQKVPGTFFLDKFLSKKVQGANV